MDTTMVHATIDGKACEFPKGTSILKAARSVGVDIPTLCHLEDVSENASCGLCLVEVPGAKSLLRACVTKVAEGMNILTATERCMRARKTNLELILANHPKDCLSCSRNGNCELQAMAERLGVKQVRFPRTRVADFVKDESSGSLVRDPNKCILCGRCVTVCETVQGVNAIDFAGRGINSRVSTFLQRGMDEVACMNCGQCALVCPTAAITEQDETEAVFSALLDPTKIVVVETAPAVRVGIGEAMGMGAGALVTGKMVAGLRRLGFNKVFDTQFSADLTIMEEGSELIHRVKNKGVLPMITSCSPGWIKFVEHFYPNLIPHLSTCKSPQQMFGSIAKTYWAEAVGADPRNIVVVSVMPCTAKKFEARRPEMDGAFHYWKDKMKLEDTESFYDVDFAITTRELARMFRVAGIDLERLQDEDFDDPLGRSTGAAVIFGATGGVMEAALRTAYELITGKALPSVDLKEVRGFQGIKTASVDAGGLKVNVAVAHTLKNARIILDEIAAGKSDYTFVEVMTCPGGCIGGGGQPLPVDKEKREARAKSIYLEDAGKPIRKSHESPAIQELYTKFLGQPLGHLSHELLHTKYRPRAGV